jgi:uncharacterized protein (DUF2249 family)
MKEKVVTLDVREDIRQGREPFSRIMDAVNTLKAGEKLLLIAPFEPAPLFGVMAKFGFDHETRPLENGDYEVLFARPAENLPEVNEESDEDVVEVDARGLEPPQPLVTILEAVASLPEYGELIARTDRRPMHLYAQLEERGFIGESEEQTDGSFITYIRKRQIRSRESFEI